MSISVNELTRASNSPACNARPSEPKPSVLSGDATRPVVSYCTSEQMDLWRQVFAEADHRARRNSAVTASDRERSH